MPEAQARCGHPDDSDSEDAGDRRTGGQGLRWMYGHGHSGERLWEKVYDRNLDPDLPGLYLSIEVFWDPIMKVRSWALGYSGISWRSDTEAERDTMSRNRGMFGYYHFVQSVGCWRYQSRGCVRHYLGWRNKNCPHCGEGCSSGWKCHQPYRWATRNSPIPLTSHEPSVWLAACHTPMTDWNDVVRNNRSHFGVIQTTMNLWRYNVVHLDGHVHDDVWKEPEIVHLWTTTDSFGFPYGWHGPAPIPEGDRIYGPSNEPAFEGAQDKNKKQK
jgi:hypothetical protein